MIVFIPVTDLVIVMQINYYYYYYYFFSVRPIVAKMFAGGRESVVPVLKCPGTLALVPNCADTLALVPNGLDISSPV